MVVTALGLTRSEKSVGYAVSKVSVDGTFERRSPELAQQVVAFEFYARSGELDQGSVVQKGTHDELIQQAGIYRDFVSERTESSRWTL